MKDPYENYTPTPQHVTDEMREQQAAVEAALEKDREKSLRDLFAGSALGAIIASVGAHSSRSYQQSAAQQAYGYADAMMEARKK